MRTPYETPTLRAAGSFVDVTGGRWGWGRDWLGRSWGGWGGGGGGWGGGGGGGGWGRG